VKAGIRLSLAFLVVIASACAKESKELHQSSPPSLPTVATHVPVLVLPTLITTSTHVMPTAINLAPTHTLPSLTSSPESPKPILKLQTLLPGIYSVFWKNGSMNIVFPSGATKELLHLYDANYYESPSGDVIISLTNPDQNALPSPSGNSITFMNKINGYVYNFNILTNEVKKIPQPESGSSVRGWFGSWSPDGRYLLYSIDHGTPEEFPSIFISDPTQGSYSRFSFHEQFLCGQYLGAQCRIVLQLRSLQQQYQKK